MDLYLVRHATAHDRDPVRWPDVADRPLTPEGEQEFLQAAKGLKRVAKEPEVTLASPFVRAWRTAELLAEGAGWPEPEAFPSLEADRPVAGVLDELGPYTGRTRIALVGHEPGMSELAWLLLAGNPAEGQIHFKKGAVARLQTPGPPEAGGATLRWLLIPDAIRKR